MESPQTEENKGFWSTNKELFLSIVIILAVMFCLKYIITTALQFHLT
jgi:predicted negative regulator of RcsB-dependent stress response